MRDRAIRFGFVTNVAARVLTAVVSFAIVPITLKYLGDERFGIWMTISSLNALLAFADLGLGNGLLNSVAAAFGRNDYQTIRKAIGTAITALSTVSAAIFFVSYLCITQFSAYWPDLLGVKENSSKIELDAALITFTGFFALNVVFAIGQKIQMAMQMGFLNGVSNILGSAFSFALLIVATHLEAPLFLLIAALMGGGVLANVLTTIYMFLRTPAILPKRSDFSYRQAGSLLSQGSLFLLLQITTALAYAPDNVIGAGVAGAEAVGAMAIAAKLFSIPTMLTGTYLASLWPAYTEALARGDVQWCRTRLKFSLIRVTGSTALFTIAIALALPIATRLWLGKELRLDVYLIAGLAAATVVGAIGAALAAFYNGIGIVGAQVMIAIVFAIACLLTKIYSSGYFGLAALPWATAVCSLVFNLSPLFWLLPKTMKDLEHRV